MFKKVSLFVMSLFILSLVLSCGEAPASGGNSSSSNPNVNPNLKSYIGAASIGDIVWYGVDNSTKQLIFSNISRQYTWSATYTEQSDGTCKFTVPVINEEASFLEVPDKFLVVQFYIRESNVNVNVPAFAMLVPHTVKSQDDISKLNGIYGILEIHRSTANDYTYGLNWGDMDAVSLNGTSYKHYKVISNFTGEKDATGPIIFSNEIGCPVVVIANNNDVTYFPIFAGEATFAGDFGIGNGFCLGLKVRTNSITYDEAVGEYVVLGMDQWRKQNSISYTSMLLKNIIILSNNISSNTLDVYEGGTNLIDSLIITNVDFEGTKAYCMVSTSPNGAAVVISEDGKSFILFKGDGNIYNTNWYYQQMFGFGRKK
jgi:hypothetical protein